MNPNYSLIIYPHKLFDLDGVEVKSIIQNSINMAIDIVQRNIGQLIAEIEDRLDVEVSRSAIGEAVAAADSFTEFVYEQMNYAMDINFKKKRRFPYMRLNYLKALHNGALVFATPPETEPELMLTGRVTGKGYPARRKKDGSIIWVNRGMIISLPLLHAVSETMTVVFDISLSKSPELRYRTSKSDDRHRRIINSIDKRRAKYLFIKILAQYAPGTEKSMIRNVMRSGNEAAAYDSLRKIASPFK